MKIYWRKTGGAWIATTIKNSKRGNSTKDKPEPDFKVEDLSQKLLQIEGDYVCIPFREAPICMVINMDGKLHNPQNIIFAPRVTLNDCHNKSVRYWKRFPKKYHFVTGFAYDNKHKMWIRHSWLLEKNNIIVETTPFKREKYFGFISDKESAKLFYKMFTG